MCKLLPLLLIIFCSNTFGNIIDRSFSKEKHQNYMKDAVLVFDSSIQVLKREYRDVEGFSITDVKRIEADRFGSKERDVFRNEVYSIRYRVSFTKPKMAKGAVGKVEGLTWSYTNSGLGMCPHYPRGLLLNERYRFYVYGISKGRAREIKLLELPRAVK